ncbi:M14 family zinc carboxypeptidase [Streptomyces sp. V3I7]|uniref:M14 family zinc carboxypeptidase n=1 Tax=Streptomyces sp. V3I7 TaxID=3042278 RepID=UPI0027822112|nr:M14 family zinc carboxypeptidase [Streptomyces sp. V3I7]MDQ0993665.1 hypothetical protein [Streptomyces sp. V3I7]
MRGTPYLTLAGLTRDAQAMVAAHPGLLRLREVGVSRAGRPLWLLSAGQGSHQVLTVAGAHANELVGGTSALRLAEELAHRPDVLDALDCAWHFLICLDPDGTAIAERWMSEAPPSVGTYYRGFYRPAFASHPEFPPVEGDPRSPMPESAALIRLIDELRPVAQFSLHGVEVGGSFMQLTQDVQGLAETYRTVAADLHIPLEHRPFDGMGWVVDSPGVLILPADSTGEERDPSGFTSQATWMYAMRHGTVSAVLEAPFWAVDEVSDPRPVERPDQEIAWASEILLGRAAQVEAVLDAAERQPPQEESHRALFTAARELLDICPGVVDTWKTHGEESPDGFGLATTRGNAASLRIAAGRIPLRAAAMMRQALGEPFAPVATALDGLVREWCHELEDLFGARWVPVRRQTALQTRTMLAITRRLLARHPHASPSGS